jgi:threonine aldolase
VPLVPDEEREERRRRVQAASERILVWRGPRLARGMLERLVEAVPDDERIDVYGEGVRAQRLEARVAELLGKEAAVFMPSGTMAQPIALRIWAERKGTRTIAYHPTCHLEIHEEKGAQLLHGLHGKLVGNRDALLTLDDLQEIHEPVAALLLELPQREIGGRLPEWDDLVAQTGWARDRGAAAHMDGARLWESGPYYERSYAEIAALFDTVYVSFYKGLGGLGGAALAGPSDLIDEARVWQRRHGGNLVTLMPYVVSAEQALDEQLPRMPEYLAKARSLAAALAGLDRLEVVPDPPQSAMLHILLRGDSERLIDAALDLAEERGVYLFGGLSPSTSPSWHVFEVPVGTATLEIGDDEARDLLAEVLARSEPTG